MWYNSGIAGALLRRAADSDLLGCPATRVRSEEG